MNTLVGPDDVKKSVYRECTSEIARHKWIESQRAGYDLGEAAVWQWVREHWTGYLRARWVEHLQGKCFWVELHHWDYGLLQRKFQDRPQLLDAILDQLKAGKENLDVIEWATNSHIPIEPVIEVLEALDVNSPRLGSRFDPDVGPTGRIDWPAVPPVDVNESTILAVERKLHPPEKPDFLDRARRVLSGEVRPDDYLAVTGEVTREVDACIRRLRAEGVTPTDEGIRLLRNDATLQLHHGGQEVLCRRTADGVIVLAVGPEQVDTLQKIIPPAGRPGYAVEYPHPW